MNNIKIILIAMAALLLGLGAGYFLFGNQQQVAAEAQQAHETATTTSNEDTWTCSMHPQIRQNEPGECPICGMDLIRLDANSSNDPLVLEMTPTAAKLANIETMVVGATGSAEKSLTLSGKIQADERLSVSQVAHIPGRIEQLFVTFTGEQVEKGQKLAAIYSPELVTAQQELLEALKIKAINPDLASAARKKLSYWKIPDDKIDAIVESGQIQETFTILADASGVVTGRQVAVGDYVKRGEVLFNMVGLNRLWVLFDAYEEDLAGIKIGDRINFTTPALAGQTFTTRISFIDPLINPTTRVASLRGEVSNSKHLLKPEMFIRGQLQSSLALGDQLTVPKSAVLWTGPRSIVYLKVPNTSIPSYRYQEITLGERLGDNYLVESGLSPGDEVVTYGNFTIDAAAQLNNQASMINRKVQVKGVDQLQHLPDYTASTPLAFKQQLVKVTEAYLSLKDAFIATDSTLAQRQAIPLLEALAKVDMSMVEGDAHIYWMEQLNAMQNHGKKISELKEVEEQRTQFGFLSQAFIHTIKVFGIPESRLYIQHCPMAFGDEGADWISAEETIRNPYFGDKMLKCGTVEETITKDFKPQKMEEVSSTAQQGAHRH
ncbi:MAG: efflux RND transporter periplasmic adaptor subunit [Saprospiraceae bacterium]